MKLNLKIRGGLLSLVTLFVLGCSDRTKEKRAFGEILLVDSVLIERPLKRFESFGDYFYCYDFLDKSLIKLDQELNPLASLGKWGEGPKENFMVRNYHILDENRLSIFDTEKHTFKIQDFEDSIYFYRKFSMPVERGVQLDDNSLILVATVKGIKLSYFFHSLKEDSYKLIEKINELFYEENSALIYEGKILGNNGFLIHTSYFSDLWFTYEPEQNILEMGSYIYDFEKPKVLNIGGGAMLDNAPLLIADAFIFQDRLAVISNVSDRDNSENRVLDIYDIESKTYLKSFILPNLNQTKATEGFAYSENKIGLLYEDKIYFFDLK